MIFAHTFFFIAVVAGLGLSLFSKPFSKKAGITSWDRFFLFAAGGVIPVVNALIAIYFCSVVAKECLNNPTHWNNN